jgi:hypothetical protein
MVRLPSAKPGIHRSFCSAVPNCWMTVPQIAGETTMSSSGQPAADSSSMTAARSPMSPPPPPHCSSTATPRYPACATASHSSVVLRPSAVHARMYSPPKVLPSLNTCSRSCWRSEVSV